MRSRTILLALTITALAATPAVDAQTKLLRQPDISESHIAFTYGGDVWLADLDGGNVRALTGSRGLETDPYFSPDGTIVAFTGEYGGNRDVFVVPVEGGDPARLTWHPGADLARGWTPDGTSVVFMSGRTGAPIPYGKLWTVSVDGGPPAPMALPRVNRGSFSPDGTHLAYQKIDPWESEWRNYRGGQANPIRIIDLQTLEVERLPWDGSDDRQPIWLGDTVYFLSDRDLVRNVWAYRVPTGELTQVTRFTTFDAKGLGGGGGRLIFENAGQLWVLDPEEGEPQRLNITVRGDFPAARPHWVEVGEDLEHPAPSPTGARVAFEARGEILTVPSDEGDPRNLSRDPGSADRTPVWSPDGRRVAWFSDRGGEYRLVIADQYGLDRREIEIEDPTFFYTPEWSPDGGKIAFGDTDRTLWVVDVDSGDTTRVGSSGYAPPERIIAPVWSPDSRWLAYAKRLGSQFGAIMLYSLESGETVQLTDGMADCRAPAWDASGRYVYFMASTDYGLNVGWLDMTSYDRPVSRALYLAVLAADEPSPLLPETGDEPTEDDAVAAGGEDETGGEESPKEDGEVEVRIDVDGLRNRIVALDVPPRDYHGLLAGTEGVIFYGERVEHEPGLRLHRYQLEELEAEKLLDGVVAFDVSAHGKKLLYGTVADAWAVVDAAGTPEPGNGSLTTDDLQIKVEPPAEWRQMFREAWRFQRDYFYVDNVHGLDMDWAWDTYAPWVSSVRHRSDLTHVLDILSGETSVGHSFVRGGDRPRVEEVPVGLLGADLEVDAGRYRIATIFTGESWNPDLRAPLAEPGVDVSEGDYLLAVNGRDVTADMNPYSVFDRTADTQTLLEIGPDPDGSDSRHVTVVPVADEEGLRRQAWIESNRLRVAELSDGKLAYVWLPNTGRGGYSNFNRYYFAQQDKQGVVVDERFNGGGSAADYMIDLMARSLMGFFNNPLDDDRPWALPNAGIWGPKVMIINDAAGSGGDLLPYMFRLRDIGPLVGTRTWGGLVGIWDVPSLIDGGMITAPRGGFYDLDGEWAVENEGVAPDIEVEQTPKLVARGHDPQLERAVEVALELLEESSVKIVPQPPDPVRAKHPATDGGNG